MLNTIIGFSIRNKLIIGLFVLALIGYGTYQTGKLPIDAVPDITNNQVQIITVSPSFGATDIERLITFPIEQACSNIGKLKEMRSFSRFGLSVVTLVFHDDMDLHLGRQMVSERLQQIQQQIPKEFGTPQLAPITTGLGEIYQYFLHAKKGYENKYSITELRTLQDWIVRRQLLSVEGVAEVSSFGGYLKQYEIAIDPASLKANNTSIAEVFAALENNNQNTGGAYIEKGPTLLFIRSEGLMGSIQDIENCVVRNLSNGNPITIRDIAEVRIGHATRYGALTYNGEREVSGAVVMMLKGANSSAVIKSVKDRIAHIQKSLPEGVVIEPFLDRTKMVNNSISTVSTNLMEGALIVVFVLVLFLGNIRAGLLVASVIPLAMLFAIILMNAFGVSGNLMSLGALDFGLIVDGAVIIVEAVMHGLSKSGVLPSNGKSNAQRMDEEVKQAAGKMMNSAVFGQVIILIVYLPIFTLQGIEGKMFKPMAQTVAFALTGAFILSLTYIPMMSALLLKRPSSNKPNWSERGMHRLENLYRRLLEKALLFKKSILVSVLVFFSLSLLLLSSLGGEFIPVLPEGDFAIESRILPGSNLKTSTEMVMQAEKILLDSFPEVEKVVGKTGSSEIPTDPMPIEASDIIVNLKPRQEWTSANSYDELITKMSAALEVIPGMSFGFQYPVAMRFNELMTGARQDVVCKIYGEHLDTLAKYSKLVGNVCSSIEGATNLYVEPVTGMPQIIIDYRRATMAQYGLTIAEVNKIVNTSFAGQSAGMVYEGEKRFDLVLRLKHEVRQDLDDVKDLLIPLPNGDQIPLRSLADVRIVVGPNQIQRENNQRRIVIGFNVRGRDMQNVVEDLQQKIDQNVHLPAGYSITYGGAFENLLEAKKRLSVAVPLALALILLMLYFAFRSIKYGLLIFTAIPLSAIGGIFALWWRNMPFSISAGVGFIALFGVAVLNGIVLIAEFNRLKNVGLLDLKSVVLQGTTNRLRPVLMTAFVASLGFLPMAMSNGEGAQVQRPLATVVIGGLFLATFLTLFVLPVLYLLFDQMPLRKSKSVLPLVLLVVMLSTGGHANAQNKMSLQQAIDSAFQNNLLLRSEKLQAEYASAMQKSAYNLPSTNLTFDHGQFNSIYRDSKLSVGQSFQFPVIYQRQHALLKENVNYAQLGVTIKTNELKKEVGMVYYACVYLLEKEKCLLHYDSVFAAYLQKATIQLQQGETGGIEKSLAQNQKDQIGMELLDIRKMRKVMELRFHLLINTKQVYMPETANNKALEPSSLQADLVKRHPLLQQLQSAERAEQQKLRVEKARLLPEFYAAYNNTSIRGIGADDQFYSASKRFQFVQVGLGIPLFFGAQKSLIRSQKIQVQQQQLLLQRGEQELNWKYEQALANFIQHQETLQIFEKQSLKDAGLIHQLADQQLAAGQINFMQWVMLIANSMQTQLRYLDALSLYNQSNLELQSILQN